MNSENTENLQNTENTQQTQTKVILEKPKKKFNLSEEEKQKRIERLQNARNRKKELEEENKQLESEYFKKKEIEIYNELYAQFEKKLNKKKKEVKTKVMQKELESDSDSEIEQKQVKQTKNKKGVIEKETKHNGGYIPPASSNPTPLFRICN